jgi:hypothetical protein
MKANNESAVASLKASATSNEDFMSKLAQLETGEISQESMENIEGGAFLPTTSFLRPPFILGILIDKTIFTQKPVGY